MHAPNEGQLRIDKFFIFRYDIVENWVLIDRGAVNLQTANFKPVLPPITRGQDDQYNKHTIL